MPRSFCGVYVRADASTPQRGPVEVGQALVGSRLRIGGLPPFHPERGEKTGHGGFESRFGSGCRPLWFPNLATRTKTRRGWGIRYWG